jgi:ubiquinone/menaquinone biosynthesis C-methylase UbiE
MRTADGKIVDTFTCYEAMVEDYDQWKEFKTVTQAEEKVLLNLIGDVEAQKILDVSCGSARGGFESSQNWRYNQIPLFYSIRVEHRTLLCSF